MIKQITIIGAGLAGCEAAWQAARRGVRVRLCEMKPAKYTPAHSSAKFAELVCSNSLRSDSVTNAVGLLKEELRRCGSLIMEAADATRVAAGSALAVDRELFSDYVTEKIKNHENIEIIEREVDNIGEGEITVIAAGPLATDALTEYIARELGAAKLYFFDAAAPIVDFDSIDMSVAFFASRWDKGGADYINCPMDREQYAAFYEELINAKTAPLHEFDRAEQEKFRVFEGCMPVEVMARRGVDTLRFGPLKPVGITLPGGGEAYAIVQLRSENNAIRDVSCDVPCDVSCDVPYDAYRDTEHGTEYGAEQGAFSGAGTMYNLVGFQTNLTFGEQKRVFSMIPGLADADFLRYGVMHRNTYINSPGLLNAAYEMISRPGVFFAGQITGVEGYVESAASGLVAGINAAKRVLGEEPVIFPATTVTGAMAAYISKAECKNFQPMNANFGLVQPLPQKIKGGKPAKNEALARRAVEAICKYSKV